MNTTKTQKSSNFITILKQQPRTVHSNTQIATLSPYIIQIQKRKKLRKQKDGLKNKFNPNNSSSKSFRISERSTTSLHKIPLQKNKEGISSILNKNINQKKFKNKSKSLIKPQPVSSFSKTLDNKRQKNDHSNQSNYFQDHYLKIKQKVSAEKDKEKLKFRKNLYQTMQTIPRNQNKSQDNCQINIKKISYTNVNIQKNNDSKELDVNKKSTGKKNYRKNKYQNLHSSVNEKSNIQVKQQPLHSQRLFSVQAQLNKKESNVNLNMNKQMDIFAQNQMKAFYRQVRTKQLQKSLEKSTQKYFKNQSYRPTTKTKNQIQIYISTVQNPNFVLQKVSRSTNDNDKKSSVNSSADITIQNKKSKPDYYNYDFDFEVPQKSLNKHHNQIHKNNFSLGIHQTEFQNSSQLQDSSKLLQENNEINFQKQRKIAEIQYFNKGHFKLDWSDDDCQIDDI